MTGHRFAAHHQALAEQHQGAYAGAHETALAAQQAIDSARPETTSAEPDAGTPSSSRETSDVRG